MTAETRRILVLGSDSQSFLTVIRSLGRAGYEVHAAWCPFDSPTLSSRYVHTVHRVPLARAGDTRWIEAFQELLTRVRFDLVLPTTDGSALPLQMHRQVFEPLARIYLLPDEVYRTCANKDETWALATRVGVAVPQQRLVASLADAENAAAEFGYPLVLKPIASADERDPGKRQKVRKAYTPAELKSLAREMIAEKGLLAQENFIGAGVGVEVLCEKGEILLAFEHERVHEPVHGGGSSYRRSVALDPELAAAAARMMGALAYTGVAMLEFKQNKVTRAWVLIEINARFWGSLALSDAAGMDFPLRLVSLLLEGERPKPQTYRTGIYCRHWSRDLQWFLANLRADKTDPRLQTVKTSHLLKELGHVLTLREYSDTFQWNDPRPAWLDLKLYLGEKLFRVFKLLRPYRVLQQRRLMRRAKRADRVLVLCYGNICRSPYAAAVLAEQLGRPVDSTGLIPEEGRTSPHEVITVAAETGVDLASHRSSTATIQNLREADLILIFDRRHWLGLRAMDPALLDRVAYLGAANPSEPLEIADPYGGDLDTFRRCYARIRRAFEQWPAREAASSSQGLDV